MEPLRVPAASLPAPAASSAPAWPAPFERYPAEKPAALMDLSLRDYWRVIHARRRTAGVICALAAAAAMLFNCFQAPVYRSTVTVQIDREQPHTARLEDTLAQPLEQPDYIETQYKILKSRTLAKAVIDKLDLAARPEYRRRWLRPELEPPRLGAELNPAVVNRFLEAVTVTPGKGTRLVEVAVDSVEPAIAARAANTLAEIYIEQNLAAKWDATQRASGWLTEQLTELKAKLERSESDVLDYAMRHSIIFVEEQKNITTEKLQQLEAELTRAEAERMARQSAYLLTQDASGNTAGNLNSEVYRELSLRLAEARREYAQILVTFAPGYPKAQRGRIQIEELEQALEDERTRIRQGVREDYLAAVEREKLLRSAVLKQTRSVNVLGDDIIQYNILKREAESNRQLYEGLLQRLKEAGVSAGLRASNIRVLDPAEAPLRPHRPKKLQNVALALAAGLMLAAVAAFVSEHLSTVVRTPEEAERLTGLSLLAVVPRARSRLGAEDPRPARQASRNGASAGGAREAGPGASPWEPGKDLTEAYRTLRSSVLLGWEDSMRRLLVTSPQPQDGKTTISLHLAWSLAQLGRRVLLIDADMRKPSCARLLGVCGQYGLGDYLAGQVEIEAVVQPTLVENLWLIPAGRARGEASDLLYSPRLAALLGDAGARWDHVVIDSPPSLALSDARTISRLVEGLILVVSDQTERASLKRTKQAFDDAGVRCLGFVMNRVDLDDLDYGHYREYGYYNYTQNSREKEQRG
jgi:succinoglycan biosynthesis transport protein ExoP